MLIISIHQAIWKKLYNPASGTDHGTLYQLRNLVQRRNVGQKPKKDFNAHDDFFNLVITSHILAAAMEILGMETLEDDPSECLFPPNIGTLSSTERKEVLQQVVSVIVNSYVDINPSVLKKPAVAESNVQDEREDDKVQVYAKELLTLGLIYREYSDAIREGDGQRVLRCWKFLMIIFKATQRKNYACEAFNLLAQQRFILSPRLSQQLVWSRFINTRGGKGNNIPCDLHMEHLNRVLKDGIKGLGANKRERAITRLGKCIDSIDQVLNNYDHYHHVHHTSHYHTAASLQKDIELVLSELVNQVRPFAYCKGRSHKRVKITKRVLKTVDSSQFQSWMEEKWQNLLAGLL